MTVITSATDRSLAEYVTEEGAKCYVCDGALCSPYFVWECSPVQGVRRLYICTECCCRISQGIQGDMIQIEGDCKVPTPLSGVVLARLSPADAREKGKQLDRLSVIALGNGKLPRGT